jgi:hypothetical protein
MQCLPTTLRIHIHCANLISRQRCEISCRLFFAQGSLQPTAAPPNRCTSTETFRPRKNSLFDEYAVLVDVDSLSRDPLFPAPREQHAKGAIGIHHVHGVVDSNGHLVSVPLGDRLESGRRIESAFPHFANSESKTDADGFEVNDPPGVVRSFIVFEPALQPQAPIAATNLGAGCMNAAALFAALMQAVSTGGFGEFIDAQYRAAMRTRPTGSHRRAPAALGINGQFSHSSPWASDRFERRPRQSAAPDGPPEPKKTSIERSSSIRKNSWSVSAGT